MASRKKTATAEVPTDPPFDVENPAPEPAETPQAFYDLTTAKAPTALSVAERAERALVIKQTEAELTELAAATVDIVEITNADGREQVHRAQITLRDIRLDIERTGKAAREDANKFLQAVIARQDKLVGILSPEEERLKALKVAYDKRIADEKAAAAAAEKKRVDDLVAQVDKIKALPAQYANESSVKIAEVIEIVATMPNAGMQEFTEAFDLAKTAAIARLKEFGEAALSREAAAAQAEADRQELARLKAEQAERDRVAAQEKAEADRKAAVDASRRQAIAQFRTYLDASIVSDSTAAEIARRIAIVEAMTVDAESFGELETEAREAKVAVLRPLRVMHAKQVQAETERAEAARVRQALEEQRAAEHKRRADLEAAAKPKDPPPARANQVDLEEAIASTDRGGLIVGTPAAPELRPGHQPGVALTVDTTTGEVLRTTDPRSPITCPECGAVFVVHND